MTQSPASVRVILSETPHVSCPKDGGTASLTNQPESSLSPSPSRTILDAGYETVVRTPSISSHPPLSPSRKSPTLYLGNSRWSYRYRKDQQLFRCWHSKVALRWPRVSPPYQLLHRPGSPRSVASSKTPARHVPISDLGDTPGLGRILCHFHNACKATAVICHRPAYALLSTKFASNSSQYACKRYKVTSWSDAEEKLVQSVRSGTVPNKVESSLRGEVADLITGIDKKLGGTHHP
ncbi:ThiJ/PfpI family protein [Ganoderma leucocontextum]|nr:ThiJ/PfpI family protein [Ganoderma leucocontextum]